MTRAAHIVLTALLMAAASPSRPARAEVAPDSTEPDAASEPSVVVPESTAQGLPASAAPVPAPTAAVPAAPRPPLEFWLGALQLVMGYGAELAGGYMVVALGLDDDIESDYGMLALAATALPAFAGGAVCGLGAASRHYRGRCWTTFLGAYAGSALGVVLGLTLAGEPGPDDTEAFMQSMAGLAGVVFLSPIGALVGYQLGKEEIPRGAEQIASIAPSPSNDRRLLTAFAPEPRRGPLSDPPAWRLVLPVVSVSW